MFWNSSILPSPFSSSPLLFAVSSAAFRGLHGNFIASPRGKVFGMASYNRKQSHNCKFKWISSSSHPPLPPKWIASYSHSPSHVINSSRGGKLFPGLLPSPPPPPLRNSSLENKFTYKNLLLLLLLHVRTRITYIVIRQTKRNDIRVDFSRWSQWYSRWMVV